MLVVWRDTDPDPDAGATLPPLQLLERPAESTMKGGGKCDGLKSGQMPPHAGLCAVFHRRVQQRRDGLPGGRESREVSAQVKLRYGAGSWLTAQECWGRLPGYTFFIFSGCFLFYHYLLSYLSVVNGDAG
jgi:hypothetical protein